MKDFFKPTKDKIIFTLVIPSYLFFFYDFSTSEFFWYWLPLPIFLFIGVVIYIMHAGANNSQINFILQKIQQERIFENESVWQNVLMLAELAIPFVFNYLIACWFFHWYYNQAKK